MRGVCRCLLMLPTVGNILHITTPPHTGDFHHSMETKAPVAARPHMMRVKFWKMYVYAYPCCHSSSVKVLPMCFAVQI